MANPSDIPAGARPGDVLAGKYRVERVLGAGGMGVVVAAHHVQLDTRVALKFLLPQALANAEAVARFLREARAAVKITGEHVARVSDVGQLESGSPYIVMEYLEGLDLAAWVAERGALPVELAVDLVLQACEAIADAHALGIVHRDLKPANLFCVRRSDGQPSIKVLDFGISKIMSPAGGNDMTRTSAIVGSPYYMSPEQLQSSKNVDTRTDLWSLGVILFELVSGRTPFEAEAVTELAIKIAMDPTPRVRTLRPEVPIGLETIIATCLEKDRGKRYPTVGELAVALGDFGSRQARASVERIVGTLRQAGLAGDAPPRTTSHPAAPPALAPHTCSSWEGSSASWGRRSATAKPAGKTAAIAVAALVVVAACALGGALVLQRPATVASGRPPAVTSVAPSVTAAIAATAPAVTSAAPPPAETLAAPPEPPSSAVGAASAAPVESPTVRATGAGNRRSPVAPAEPRPAAAEVKPGCDPPYYFDAKGARVFKKECM